METIEAGPYHFNVICYNTIDDVEGLKSFLKEKQPPVCLVDSRVIVGKRQLMVSVHNACAIQAENRMFTKSIYLEILRCLCPDGRLQSALKYCTISSKTTSVVAITLEDQIPNVPFLSNPVSFDELFKTPRVDAPLFEQIYKVTEEMREIYTYEEIAVTTLSIIASDLLNTKAL